MMNTHIFMLACGLPNSDASVHAEHRLEGGA
jgi:hypothetical protein